MTTTQSAAEPEIQNADPRLRRALLVVLPLLALASLGALWWLHRRMLDLEYAALASPGDAADGVLVLSSRFFAGLAMVLAVVGSWYAMVAWKTLRGERYPPADLPLARDTRVRHGAAARLRGLVGLFLAIVLLLLALVLPAYGPRVVYDRLLPAFEGVE